MTAIRLVAAGESPFSEAVLRRVVRTAVDNRSAAAEREDGPFGPGRLTDREREVLGLIGEGLSNPEIAHRLHIGVTTVKTHVASLMTKSDSPNRVRLAVLAARGLTSESG